MNIIPETSGKTGSYFCTWDSQCDEMHCRYPDAQSIPSRDAMCEEFLFGENGLLRSFDGIREDLIVVLDDGWDVPYGTTDTRMFGLLDADPERFPSLKELSPAQKLKELSDRVLSLGYRGLGLWIPTQTPSLCGGKEINLSPQQEREYWEERAKWCNEAGVVYWKADWGKHQGDADYCRMMTECARKYAPGLSVEHGLSGYPKLDDEVKGHFVSPQTKEYLRKVFPYSDYLRTYDVIHELKYASTVDRVSVCLEAAQEAGGPCPVLNIEDTGLIGAALGCAIGVMRHDKEKIRKYLPLPFRPVSDTVSAVRWQRIAPPFPADEGELNISGERLKDTWHCPVRPSNLWPNLPEGFYSVTAPAAVSRNMPLPEVIAGGEKPYVVSSVNPGNGALCVAVTPRTFPDEIDRVITGAEIYVKASSATSPAGLFGTFGSVKIEYPVNIEGRTVYAQSLLSDTARDVTGKVCISGNTLTVPGSLMNIYKDDENGIPAIVIQIIK